MRIIGIDPGTAITGLGIIEHQNENISLIHYDTINLDSKNSLPDKLKRIYDECLSCILKFNPDELAIETALKQCGDKLIQFGGHFHAAGLEIELEKINDFRKNI